RGGAAEAIRVAVFNLVDRGWLAFDGKRVHAVKGHDGLRRTLDKTIVGACSKGRVPGNLESHSAVRQAAAAYAEELAQRGLLLPPAESRARLWFGRAAIAVLLVVALTKCGVALSQGRANVGFLIVLA